METETQTLKPARKPRGKREETKAQNRAVILDAARRVFSEMGYAAATVRDIIRATPLASGTFYNYFKSKEEVFQAIHDETALKIRPRLREERARAETVEQFVSGTYRVFFEYVVMERAEFLAGQRKNENLRVRMDTPKILAGFEELREDIERATARGFFPSVDAALLKAAMVGVAFEVAEEMLKREPPDAKGAAAFATALFMNGIRGLPARMTTSPGGGT